MLMSDHISFTGLIGGKVDWFGFDPSPFIQRGYETENISFLEKVSHKELLFNPITCTIHITFIVFQRKFLIKNSSFNPIACLYHRYNILLVLITIKLGGQLYGSPLHKPKLYILVMCFEQKSGHLLIFL